MANIELEQGFIQTEESKIYDFLMRHEIDYAELHDVGRLVALGISLREQHRLEIMPQTEQAIIMHIANSLYLTSKYSDLPIPNGVGFVQGKRGIPNRAVNNGLYVAAESSKPVKFPDGLISFSPFNLVLKTADVIEGRVNGVSPIEGIRNIAKLASHEVHHLKQRRDRPVELDRDIEILETKGLAAWSKTPSELEAVGFEKVFGNVYILALEKIKPLN